MRARNLAAWQLLDDDSSKPVSFVVTIKDIAGNFSARFCERADDFSDISDLRPGLLSDLDGLTVQADPRKSSTPLPSIGDLIFDESAIRDWFGGTFPKNLYSFEVEVALIAEGIEWEDRIIIITGSRIDESDISHQDNGTVEIRLHDPLDVGTTILPEKLIDIAKLPSAWTAANLQNSAQGKPFPICLGEIHRAPPIKVYDDGGGAAVARKYILAGHALSGSSATIHRRNSQINNAGAAYDDTTETIKEITTTDGHLFSYIETSAGTEDTTASPPVEVHAISFVATSGERASAGGIVREIFERYTDLDFDEETERSMSDLVSAFSPIKASVLINSSGSNRADARSILDRRFADQFPMSTIRVGGTIAFIPLNALMFSPGRGYIVPAATLSLGVDTSLLGTIRERGDLSNYFSARYRQRESGEWEKSIVLTPDNDFRCEESRSYYGLRMANELLLPDVIDGASASAILGYLRDISLFPWYETRLRTGFKFSYIDPGTKIRLYHDDEPRIASSCPRYRYTLMYEDESPAWRDAIVVAKTYRRTGIEFDIIF